MLWKLLPPVLACGCCALGLLTVVRAPARINWRLALLAGELGWLIAGAPLLLGWLAWNQRAVAPVLAGVTLAAALPAVLLLMSPVLRGWWAGRRLEARLVRAFGPGAEGEAVKNRGVTTHGFAPGLALDFYPVSRADGRPVPCIVMLHGGGWDGGDRAQLGHFNHRLARMGYAVAAISYRLAPVNRWPAQGEDTLAALAWLKGAAGQLGIDPGKFVLMGRSAGGQIATAVGYAGDPAVRGVIAFYAPHDMRFAWSVSREDDALNSLNLMRQFLGGPPEGREEIYDTASGQLRVSPQTTPPTLLVHGTLDGLVWVRHSQRLAARLREAGIAHLFLELPWGVHACEYTRWGPGGRLTTRAVAHFLAAVTR